MESPTESANTERESSVASLVERFEMQKEKSSQDVPSRNTGHGTGRRPERSSQRPTQNVLPQGRTDTSCGNMASDDRSLTVPHRRQGYEILPISQRDLAKKQTSVPLILPNDCRYDPSSGKVVKQKNVKRTHLVLGEEALELLQDVTDPVSVVGICGTARSGKSYVLSRMVGAHEAFELGNEMNPKTFGIWMGTKVLRNRKKGFTTILIDSEGTDACDAEAANDVGILVMTVLLTSQLIYNSVKVPKKKDLEELKTLTDVTGKIRARENEEVTEDMGALRRVFPNFMWLLRDVHLKFIDPDTEEEMTPTAYIKKVVFRKASQEETDQEKIGRLILMAFQRVEAFPLPSPGDEDLLEDIAANANAIKPKFNEKMNEFIEHILSRLECKRGITVGSRITGDQLATMLQHYVEAVNDPGTIPVIKSAWDASVELRCKKILEDMVAKYNTEMKKAIKEVCLRGSEMDPMEESDGPEKTTGTSLMSIHDTVMDNVRNELTKQIGFLGCDGENKDHLLLIFDFNKRIVKRENQDQENSTVVGGELHQYLEENRERSRRYCEKVFKKLLDELKKRLSPIPDDYTEKTLEEDLEKLKKAYQQQAIGPRKLDVLQERWDSSDMPGFFQMCKTIKGFQTDVAEAKRKLDAFKMEDEKRQRHRQNNREEAARQKTEDTKASKDTENNYEEAIKKLHSRHEEDKANLNMKLKDLQNANQQVYIQGMQDAQKRAEEQTMTEAQKLAHEREMLEKTMAAERASIQIERAAMRAEQAEEHVRKLKNRGWLSRLFNWDS